MIVGPVLVFLAIALQSSGKVLYGTLLGGVPTPLFMLCGATLTALVFLGLARFALPREGRGALVLLNVWTALSFIAFFYALKHLPPAVYGSIDIGMSLVVAVALASVRDKVWPAAVRILVCVGIIAGCAVLSWAEIVATVTDPNGAMVWTAVVASAIAGGTSVMSLSASRKLANLGWTPAATLGHRLHLTIVAVAIWLPFELPGLTIEPAAFPWIVVVGLFAILLPLLLFQLAVRRTDELTVMVCLAAQPVLSFLLSMPSPAYDWDVVTLAGVIVVTLFVGLDIAAKYLPFRLPAFLTSWRRNATAA